MIRLFALLIIITTLCFAADPHIRVTVDRNKIYEGDSVTLTVSVENGNGYPQLNISDIEDFQTVTGPNQSSNMQWVNGEVTSSHSLVYVMVPKNKGELFIPELTIKAEGKTYKSKPISVIVYERKDQFTTGTQGNPPESRYFIEASVDKPNPFRGEQITLTYTIYTKVDISGFDIKKIPRYQGFWTHELNTPRNLQLREVVRDGAKWYAGTVKKIALFPTQSGIIDIEPLTAVIGLRVEDRSQRGLFSNMFATTKNYSISSNSVQLDVQSLPPNSGKVSAAVGDWAITSRITANDVKQNEAVTLTIRLRGKGNLQAVDIQDINFPDEIEVFDPTINVDEHPQGDVVAGTKTIEYVLIPRGTGNIKLPSVELSYFDLRTKQWRAKATQPIVLKVTPGDRNYSTEIGFTKKEVSLMGRDIRFADHRTPTWRRSDAGMVSPWTVTFLFAAVFLYFIPWFLSYNQARVAATAGSRQARKALKSALESLKNYTGDPSKDYRNIQSALTVFLDLKQNTRKERSTSDIVEAMKANGVSDEIMSKIENILTRGDAVRFAPVSREESKTDFQTMSTALEELDQHWSVK